MDALPWRNIDHNPSKRCLLLLFLRHLNGGNHVVPNTYPINSSIPQHFSVCSSSVRSLAVGTRLGITRATGRPNIFCQLVNKRMINQVCYSAPVLQSVHSIALLGNGLL